MKKDNIFDTLNGGAKLPLIDEFYTLQGEGFHFGKAAYFIRVGGCDIGCSFCDTKYSWQANFNKLVDIKQIIENIKQTKTKTLVVTGGEPLLYNLYPLCNLARQNNIQTFIETSGTHKLTGNWNWICLSPKQNVPPVQEIISLANELKIIINTDRDFDFAEKYIEKTSSKCHLFLQPEWSKREKLTPIIVDYIKKHPYWRISVQTHKFIGIP